MSTRAPLGERLEERLWPLAEAWAGLDDVAGLGIAVVAGDEVVTRGLGTRDVRTGAPVTADTLFHLASVSKPFVATAAAQVLDLDAPLTTWIPELVLADGRGDALTPRLLLGHTSGLPDVTDYGWHTPLVGDDALESLVPVVAGWRLRSEPGTAFAYSNVGYDLIGLAVARASRTTFETAVRRLALAPLGLDRSTFLRSEVDRTDAAAPHVAMPLVVPGDSYPYTRRHAPSSTLHSSLAELCRWATAHLDGSLDAVLGPGLRDLLWRPVVQVGDPPWDEHQALGGWSLGSRGGLRTVSHSGLDPGFGARVALVPERGVAVVVLSCSNTVPVSALAAVALDAALDLDTGATQAFSEIRPTGVAQVSRALADGSAASMWAEVEGRDDVDLDDDVLEDAVWGAIELHRSDLVQPLLHLWLDRRPDSPTGLAMAGWAHLTRGDSEQGRALLERALTLDPGHQQARGLLGAPSPGNGGPLP